MLERRLNELHFFKIFDKEVPLTKREHARKYQYIISKATGWRKRIARVENWLKFFVLSKIELASFWYFWIHFSVRLLPTKVTFLCASGTSWKGLSILQTSYLRTIDKVGRFLFLVKKNGVHTLNLHYFISLCYFAFDVVATPPHALLNCRAQSHPCYSFHHLGFPIRRCFRFPFPHE